MIIIIIIIINVIIIIVTIIIAIIIIITAFVMIYIFTVIDSKNYFDPIITLLTSLFVLLDSLPYYSTKLISSARISIHL